MKRALCLLSLLAACRSASPTPARAPRPHDAPAASRDASRPDVAAVDVLSADAVSADAVSAAVAAPAASPDRAAAYADEVVVRELAGDPRWAFPADNGDDSYGCSGSIRPQSCEPNPCHSGVGQRCRNTCERDCQGVDRGCRAAAVTCRAPCADEACRVACARVEARCLDDAIAAKDRCLTGVCEPRQAHCEEAQARRFHEGPCRATCQRCASRCEGRDGVGDCYVACFRRTPGCNPSEQSICMFMGADYGAHPETP